VWFDRRVYDKMRFFSKRVLNMACIMQQNARVENKVE
jgi:hypothetical protein